MIPFRVSAPATSHFSPSLLAYIERAYSEDSGVFKADAAELDSLRLHATSSDGHVAHVAVLLKYLGQLHHLALKFPLDYNNNNNSSNDSNDTIKIYFAWSSALDPRAKTVSSPSINFERASIIFNVGALYSKVAAAESTTDALGIKQACSHFQAAAGAFKYLQAFVADSLKDSPPGGDLSTSALFGLTNSMLAHAQDCFVIKGLMDNMKDASVIKLAAKAAEFYETAYENCGSADIFPREYMAKLYAKIHYHHALASFKRANECDLAGKYGEKIAWLQKADERLKHALENKETWKYVPQKSQTDIKTLSTSITAALTQAIKDNDVIYLLKVPSITDLDPLPKADMVKPTPFPDFLAPSIVGTPVFAKLFPLDVHKKASVYASRRDITLKNEDLKAKEATQMLWASLGSLSLPGAIDALENPMGLPKALLSRSQEIRNQGGSRTIIDMQNSIQEMGPRHFQILRNADSELDNEIKADEDMRAQFKGRWNRKPSSELQLTLRSRAAIIKDRLSTAQTSDKIVYRKIEKHLAHIDALSGSPEDLEASIPESTATTSLAKHDPHVKALKQLLEEVNVLVNTRTETLDTMNKLKSTDDISQILLEKSTKKESTTDSAIFDDQLEKYKPLQTALAASLRSQETLLAKIADMNAKFVVSKNSNDSIRQREQALQNLDEAYKAFKELLSNLQEGIKFYTDMSLILERFAAEVKDYCFARNIDRKDYLGDITEQLAKISVASSNLRSEQSTSSSPARAQYHSLNQHFQTPPSQSQFQLSPQQPQHQALPPPASSRPLTYAQALPQYQTPPPQFQTQQFVTQAPIQPPIQAPIQGGQWDPSHPIQYSSHPSQSVASYPPPNFSPQQQFYSNQILSSVPPPFAPGTAPNPHQWGQPIVYEKPLRKMPVPSQPTSRPLTVDRRLLNPSFDHYKLSLSSGIKSVTSTPLHSPIHVDKVPSLLSTPYKILEARGRFNHLKVVETGDCRGAWFVNASWTVTWARINDTGTVLINPIFTIPEPTVTLASEYPSIHSLSNTILLVNSGSGCYYILEIDAHTLPRATLISEITDLVLPRTIHDAKLVNFKLLVLGYNTDNILVREKIGCAISAGTIAEPGLGRKIGFFEKLWEIDMQTALQTPRLSIEGFDAPYFAFISADSNAVMLGAEHMFDLPTAILPIDTVRHTLKQHAKIDYIWTQTESDITVFLHLPNVVHKSDVQCKFTSSNIKLSLAHPHNIEIFDAKPFDDIVASESCWTIEDGKLVTLYITKPDHACRWTHFWEHDDQIEETVDPSVLAEIRERMERFTGDLGELGGDGTNPMDTQPTTLESRQEDCDLETSEALMMRFQIHPQQSCTDVNLCSGQQWICPGMDDRSICLKYDVDGTIFDFHDDGTLTHSATIPAFAFIQASKRDRKFVRFSPDFQYGIIVETRNRMYIYRHPDGQGTVKQGDQFIVDLGGVNEDVNGNVVGIGMLGNDRVIVLQESGITVVVLDQFTNTV